MSSMWILIVVALVALVGLGFWAYRRYGQTSTGRDDRYTPERIMVPEHASMLTYLHDTFPGQVVLPQVKLSSMLSVRRSNDRKRAMQRLEGQQVDFVVCNPDGRPVFAFDIEQYHLSDAKAKTHKVKLKNRILKTAGVRFVFLKNGIHRMPSPNDFRKQLDLAALPQPKPKGENDPADSVRQQLESKFSEFDQLAPSTGFRESEVMGLSGVMGLEIDEIDRSSRQRPPTVRSRA
ncbi:MAG: DUF2726 domain-containing protein [Burkholderiaceae bacterium]